MSDMDKDLTDMNEKGRNEVQEVLAMATGVTTMIVEELDKNPKLIENIKVLCTKYADVILAIAKPLVDYSKAEELKLCEAKFEVMRAILETSQGSQLHPDTIKDLLVAAFSRS
jgi:hypothetical protein